jgi:hypothetical protein
MTQFPHALRLSLTCLTLAAAAHAGAGTPSTLGRFATPEARRTELREIDQALRQAKVRDARRQVLDSRPWARADVRSLAGLDAALEAVALEEMVRLASDFLETAARDGEDSFTIELARLDEDEWARLAGDLGCSPSIARECVPDRYAENARALLAADLATLRGLTGRAEVVAWLRDLRDDLRPSVKSKGRVRRRALTAPAWPVVALWKKRQVATEYEGPQWIDFGESYRLYAPDVDGDDRLLARWAPVLVQEVGDGPEYPEEVDRIGSLRLVPGGKGPEPVVDTRQPASYAYRETLTLDGRDFDQLVYTFWYPEHPKLKRLVDPEAGKIEGITLRLTLDSAGRPRLYETVYNCGCFHRVFVDRELEAAAAAELGPPEESRPYSIQRHLEGRIDWMVPELVDFAPAGRPMLFVRAGFHLPASVRYELPEGFAARAPEPYELEDYAVLERLPYGDGYASLFTPKGLVRGAGRLEGALLAPLGMLAAGRPRQRGTQLIHFDQADFDDPDLFADYLRLPSLFFAGGTSETVAASRASTPAEAGGSEP